jgi:hypothetical protein
MLTKTQKGGKEVFQRILASSPHSAQNVSRETFIFSFPRS